MQWQYLEGSLELDLGEKSSNVLYKFRSYEYFDPNNYLCMYTICIEELPRLRKLHKYE